MSVSVVYTCDVCKQVIPDSKIWQIIVRFAHQDFVGGEKYMPIMRQADCCRPCAERLALVNSFEIDKPPPEPPPIEDLLREIIRDEIAAAQISLS